MGLREEIDGLPRYGCEFEYVRQVDVLRIIAKHAAPTGIMIVPGTRIAPAALVDRWLGGDSIAALAADFELSADAVEATIRQWADERTRVAVDMTPGLQPRVVALFCEGCRKSVPFLHRHKGMMLCDPCINP